MASGSEHSEAIQDSFATQKVNGLTVTILGVMPAGFAFPPGEIDPPELWFPQQINPASPGGRASHFQNVVGRLKPGVTIGRARKEFQAS